MTPVVKPFHDVLDVCCAAIVDCGWYRINVLETEHTILFEIIGLHGATNSLIGPQGSHVNAMRTLLEAMNWRHEKKVRIEVHPERR
jgi:predicted RNA-binding protein YlqC (UPF0109 family)